MSKTVDERIVSMKFDNSNFEKNVSTSMSTLDKLKKLLRLDGATKGLEEVSSAAKGVNMSFLSRSVDEVKNRFSALEIMGVTALANITNSAVNTGKNLIKSLAIDPITGGFQEYETQLNSVQTILANTQSKGSTLEDVNKALNELNTYADQTIYNFTEMTRNIGTFTAAGVDLETSVSSIKGIANLAAISGSTSAQASTAMYQLSQALAAGKVQLMDWNSVVNAGMGGEVFQTALKRTATQMGKNVDELIAHYGSFRESLTEGEWLTTDVLTETLTQLSGAYSKADLIAKGYSESQAEEIVKLAETAVGAATDVKTFTQLMDTAKEAVGSGWAQTWQIIMGDFEESKELWTGVSDVVTGFIGKMSDSRNTLLDDALSSKWNKFSTAIRDTGLSVDDFQTHLTKVAKDHGVSVDELIEKEGSLRKVIERGKISKELLSESIKSLTESQKDSTSFTEEEKEAIKKLGEEAATTGSSIDNLMTDLSKSTEGLSGRELIISSLGNALKPLGTILGTVGEAWREVFPPMTSDRLYEIITRIHDFSEKLKISDDNVKRLKSTFKGAFSALSLFGKGIKAVLSPFGEFISTEKIGSFATGILKVTSSVGDFLTELNNGTDSLNFFNSISGGISKALGEIADVFSISSIKIEGFGDVLSYIGDIVSRISGKIGNGLKSAFSWFTDTFSAGDIFAGLAGGGIFVLAKNLSGFIDNIKESIEGFLGGKGNGLVSSFKDVLGGVHDSLESFSSGLKVASIVAIAVAITLLSSSLRTISELEVGDVTKSIMAIGVMLGMLTLSFKSINKNLSKFKSSNLIKAGLAMIAMAAAIKILAGALSTIAEIDSKDVIKGLTTVGVALLELSAAIKLIGKTKISLKTSVAIIVLAQACKMLAEAVAGFSGMSWDEIGRGLAGMGGALGELAIVLAVLSKAGGVGSMFGSVGILIAVQSLSTLANGLEKFGDMSWDVIEKGLVGMGGALGELMIVLSVLSKVGGFGAILGSTAILITVQSLSTLADDLKKFGTMPWNVIEKGLAAMGGALGELTIALSILSKVGGFSSLFAAGAILIVVQGLGDMAESLKKFGGMSWDEIGRGLTAMGGALGEVTLVLGLLSKIGGFSSLFAAGAILIVINGLGDLADSLKKFGDMTWDEIGRGLVGMGGALAEVAIVLGLLGKLGGFSSLFAAGSILIVVQGLGDVADAMTVFGGMTWDEIARGLVGMGGALAEIAIVAGLLGNLGGFASLIGSGSILLAVQGLGDIADALKKFGEMSWDEIGRGLSAMGGALGETALGGLLNTLSGLGAISIGLMAKPLGDLADSIKKWEGVSVPANLGIQLAGLADGVKKFTFGGFGAGTIAELAQPLGALAGSVNKWRDVSVPLTLLEGLTSLAEGVKAFSPALMGGWSMSNIVEPLGDLAGSVSKWKDVSVPYGMDTKLASIADGVKSFSGFFNGGWSLSSLIEPLGDLGAVLQKHYNGLYVSPSIGTAIEGLGDGVGSLSGVKPGNVSKVCTALGELADMVTRLSRIDFTSVITKLSSLSSTLNRMNVPTDAFSNLGNRMIDAFIKAINDGTARAKNTVKSFATLSVSSLTSSISSYSSRIRSAGELMLNEFSRGFTQRSSSLKTNIVGIINSTVSSIKGKQNDFYSSAIICMNRFVYGFSLYGNIVPSYARSIASSTVSAFNGYQNSFYVSGANAAIGFANGLSAYSYLAAARARVMASSAVRAAQRELDEHSPSKVFYGIGEFAGVAFVNALGDYASKSYKAGTLIASKAKEGLGVAIRSVGSILENGIDAQPTIRPVVDLSDVRSGARTMGQMFSEDFKVGSFENLRAINSMIGQNSQNGSNDEVVSAINKLRRELGSVGGDTYNLNGITYDDGTNVSTAVKELIRAIKIERRR